MCRSEPENSENNTSILERYYKTFDKLVQLNKSIIALDPDAELPDNLMPKEYVDFWLTKKE